jgi:hypothetical protein
MAHPPDDARNVRETFARYREMIESLVRPAIDGAPRDFTAEDALRVQVERGVVFPELVLEPARAATAEMSSVERLIMAASPVQLASAVVVDRTAHVRQVYRPLLVYAWLQAYRLAYEILPRSEFGRWEEGSRPWCDDLERRLGEFAWPAEQLPAAMGDSVAEACWTGLALHIAGRVFIRDAWTDLAADVFGKLARRQRESGAFLAAGLSDNPETWWFHELAILHAAASYAAQGEDRSLAAAVARATAFHMAETQPDHATNQPWALFAFIWNAQTRPVADGMLHAARAARSASESSGIALMLLADALYCLRLFGV